MNTFTSKILFSISVIVGSYILLFLMYSLVTIKSTASLIGQTTDTSTELAIKKKYNLDKTLTQRLIINLNDLSPIGVYSIDKNSIFYSRFLNDFAKIRILNISDINVYIKEPYLQRSYITNEKVVDIVYQKFYPTLILALLSMIFASIVGVMLGMISAIKYDTIIDKSILFISSIGVSVPSFFAAIVIALFFGYYLSEFTGLNFRGSLYDINDNGNKVVVWKNIILPVLALGIKPIAIITQITRNSILNVDKEDYIRTAYAKGLHPRVVFVKHILRNALNPVITSISGWFGSLLAGAYFVEYIFDYKGLGYLTINSLLKFDTPVVLGSSLYVGLTFIVISFLVDIIYTKLDPRVIIK